MVGQSIQYVKKCIQLGHELCPMNKHVLVDNAVNDLNCRLNNLLSEKLFGYCGKYRIELITNLFTLLITVCLLTLHWKNVVLNIYGI